MGEISEMIEEGILCQVCGVALINGPKDKPCGYAKSCKDCRD